MLPAETLSVDDAGNREELKMLGDRLPRDPKVVGHFRDRSRSRFRQLPQQPQSRLIA